MPGRGEKNGDMATRNVLASPDSTAPTRVLEEPRDNYHFSNKDKNQDDVPGKHTLDVFPETHTPRDESAGTNTLDEFDSFVQPLSKKERKRKEKLAKQNLPEALDTEEPTRSLAEEELALPVEVDQFDYTLSAKEKKKRAKEAKRLGKEIDAAMLVSPKVAAPLHDEALRSDRRDQLDQEYGGEPKPIADHEGHSLPGFTATEGPKVLGFGGTVKSADQIIEGAKVEVKTKRNSIVSHSPTAASPLRSEITYNDYVGPKALQSEDNSFADEPKDERYEPDQNTEQDVRDHAGTPRSTNLPSPESERDVRSVVSAPVDDFDGGMTRKSRRSRHDINDEKNDDEHASRRSHSVAASEPTDVYNNSKKHKRRSKHDSEDFDDAASVPRARSSHSRQDDDDAANTKSKQEKKGGIFALFRRKSSDTTPRIEEQEDEDQDRDSDKKHKRHHRRTSSERGSNGDRLSSASRSMHRDGSDRDDSRSNDSRRRSRHRDDQGAADDYDETRSQVSESGRRHKHRHRDRSDEDSLSRAANDNDDDSRSQASESRRKHRHRHEEGGDEESRSRATRDEFDDTRSQTSESRRRHKSRHRDPEDAWNSHVLEQKACNT